MNKILLSVLCAVALSVQADEAYLFSYFSDNAHEGRSGQSIVDALKK